MDQKDNPTPPAEGQGAEAKQDGPTVQELLAASRGEVTPRGAEPPAKGRPATPVTPPAFEASSGTVPEAAPRGDAPGKSVPATTPQAARATPSTGAARAGSTPTAAVAKGVGKGVATKTPAGPIVQSAPEPPINKLRRRIVWASVASFLGVSFLMFLRFFLPRAITEPSSVFRIGFPGDYSFGVDTKWQHQYRVWVVRNSERLFVIHAVCTHLGCTPDWKASENKFKCPCHGSGYDSEGVNFEGPAPRPMDRAHVEMDAEGQIVVNKDRLYKWEKGKESEFNNEGAFIRV
ncbi:MAG TPA: Rieske 2Fe-2S domain-containing protein [Pyrinomonadaceae bacterium]|nr:Rieske 2Fe-2S domain-containing protein [Pyrinomonadaceae bacterium]